MVRYMLFMSYIGTRYRGAQKQTGSDRVLDVDTIQGALETAFLTLVPRSSIKPVLTLSSRTDAGVHALCATAHLELENRYGTVYESDSVLKWINRYLNHCGHEIRLTSFFPIDYTFHARYAAKSRTYLYRIVCAKNEGEHRLPIAEIGHAWGLCGYKLDVEKLKAATQLFMGRRNFETFTGKIRTNQEVNYVKTLNEFRVEEGQPFVPLDALSKNFDYWNIIVSSKSFLYNQVRRMVAAAVAVGTGNLTEKEVRVMLQVPSPKSWNPRIYLAPPSGLFLKEITYDPEQLAQARIHHLPVEQSKE